jgi:hypothetical protein
MSLESVDLPSIEVLKGRWAAYSAVMAALGYASGCIADGPHWHYDDGGGNFADLMLYSDGRAVLFGNDHEYSQTYFREAAAYFQEPETDLLAGAPSWWGDPLPTGNDQWIGFVYGFEAGSWRRAVYDLDDGFNSLGLPAASGERFADLVEGFVSSAGRRSDVDFTPDRSSIKALAQAGANLAAAELLAVLGPVPGDVEAGVAAARAFAPR